MEPTRIQRIARFGLTTSDADRLANFYRAAFDCRVVSTERVDGSEFRSLMNIQGGAQRVVLRLGSELIELLQFDAPGRRYPDTLSPTEALFQHFAIVVTDMRSAWQRLSTIKGWSAQSTRGPVHLPRRSGGVTAFKFRDPEGHPLELLEFPHDDVPPHWQRDSAMEIFLGIDHSAVSVRNTSESIEFYDCLGFHAVSHALNHGIEQEDLDGVPTPRVQVTALAPFAPTPHVELLCYEHPVARRFDVHSNDIFATRLVLAAAPASMPSMPSMPSERIIQDPDGHRLQLISDQT